jgi:hypothetical protein
MANSEAQIHLLCHKMLFQVQPPAIFNSQNHLNSRIGSSRPYLETIGGPKGHSILIDMPSMPTRR